MIMKEDSNII